MKPVRDIEETIRRKLHVTAGPALHDRVLARIRNADVRPKETTAPPDVEVNGGTDPAVLSELVDAHRTSTTMPTTRLSTLRRVVVGLAAVVALTIAAVLLLGRRESLDPGPTKTKPPVACALRLATALSLEKAFHSGGMEAMEEQYRKAYRASKERTENPSVEDLMAELETETRNPGDEVL